MKELLVHILEHIVENPESLSVQEEEVDGITQFRVDVPKEQMGKVIGKGGKTINAIKTVVKILAAKEDKRIEIQLVEQ